MILARATLQSISAYGQGRHVNSVLGENESYEDHEIRVWKEKAHFDRNGDLIIPPMAFSNSLKEASKFLSVKIPGKRNATYTKHFVAGVIVTEPLIIATKEQLEKEAATENGSKTLIEEWLFVPSDGKRGGSSRVTKCFPLITAWSGIVDYFIVDEEITQEVFKKTLVASGNLIGIGRFRPINCGYYGRFQVKNLDWITNYQLPE
jgi:hypothetical protein